MDGRGADVDARTGAPGLRRGGRAFVGSRGAGGGDAGAP
jgi:hypothetical protein